MSIKFKKVYTVSHKSNKPRLYLQHLVCEEAGFKPGEGLYVSINEESEEIIIQNCPISEHQHTVRVSSKVSNGKRRPVVDTAGDRYTSLLSIKQKVEICVYERKKGVSCIVIRPLQFKMKEQTTIPSQPDERLRLLSVCAGAGIGTASFLNGYFTSVMEVELEDDSTENLRLNYPRSYIFNGDLRDCNEVAEADVVNLTLPCNEYSSLGFGDGGMVNNLALAASQIVQASNASVVFMENVPKFFKSESYDLLRELLSEDYPHWTEKRIESHEYGSIARRNRTYAVGFRDRKMFEAFSFPQPPKGRRRRLKEFMDGKHTKHEWKSLERWHASFESRSAWRDRSLEKTFVTPDAQELQTIPARYRSHCASNSYVLNDDRTHWRFLTENELRRIFSIPKWFQFSEHIPMTRRVEMIGQSVDGRIISSIANKIATSFFKYWNKSKEVVKEAATSLKDDGQFEFII